ncbi:MAG TPA: DNA-binding response regulator, partial [Flavobacteriaceae bacterium]|nr:DNA-binding response regulator [Flavobacteriaceae bacterium]
VKSIQNKVLYLKDEEIPIGETYKNVILEFFKV